jgi:hypothetical protein
MYEKELISWFSNLSIVIWLCKGINPMNDKIVHSLYFFKPMAP